MALAARKVATPHDAEDIASLAIVAVATSRSFDDGVDDPWPYLATTAARLLAANHRQRIRAEILSRNYRLGLRQPCLEDAIADRDMARRALRRVQAKERSQIAAMMLRRADGATWAEVFAEFGVSFSAGQSRVWRAQQRARRYADARKNLA